MDLDNPSYFSVAGGSDPSAQGISSKPSKHAKIMGNVDSISSSSECSLNRQLTPPRNQNKGSLRSFLRSVSSTSADSNQELLIMGEPRLADIAPELSYKYRMNCEPRRANSLKNKSDLHNDLMYCPLPTSEEAAAAFELSGDEEVFISEDSARYYNFSAVNDSSQRRHSIGTFMTRERSVSLASSSRSFKEDLPAATLHATSDGESVKTSTSITIDDHSLRHGFYPRKRCNRCTRGLPTKLAHMDDILIISLKCSPAATLWVEYFTSYFLQISKQANRKPFKVQHLGVEEITSLNNNIKHLTERASNVKLQLVVVCPGFLEHIAENPESSCGIGKLLLPDRTLALLLGVSDDDLTNVHKNALPNYFQWQRLSVGQDQDENFTKEFLNHAMAIFSKVWKQQSSILAQEKSQFSISPKKIRQGQNSVLILLTYPLQKEDAVKILVERNNEITEIKSMKRRNPYVLKIFMPEHLTEVSAIVNILVEKNGSIIGSRPVKCESRLRELEQILRSSNNPIEFMCQTMGFSPSEKEHLDNWMVHSFQKNLPPHFNLLINDSSPYSPHMNKQSYEEFPTLLHFAARFGLEKLTMQLLDCPGAELAYELRNSCDLTPAEIAENAGHAELANTLRGYMKMNEVSCMYAKLKEISLNTNNEPEEDEQGYLTPKNIGVNDFYKICPPPRPINLVNSLTSTAEQNNSSGYMAMSATTPESPNNFHSFNKNPECPSPSVKKDFIEPSPPKNSPSPPQPKNCDALAEDKVQKELLEIINDFKNNVHSISQVEKLVEEWKNRNDVQKSFKEKQEQLNEMRLKYEKIQQDMKNAMKKPTPFDRVKRLFSRTKSREDKQDISAPIINNSNIQIVPSQRPISSLSLQSTSSSSSSGRMSTISGCSLGDSGTHSDQEERKQIMNSEDDLRKELSKAIMNLNYSTVPAPKPFKPGMYPNRNLKFETIEERPMQTTAQQPDLVNTEHYILFPPSGLPVEGINQSEDCNGIRTSEEYMNIPSNGLIITNHEYMNFKAPQSRTKT